jgi:hypothetical protein
MCCHSNPNPVTPIVCPTQYVVRDFYTTRAVPVVQPVVTVNRQNVVDVPQYFVQPMTTNVVVDRGFQGFQGSQGFLGRRFL